MSGTVEKAKANWIGYWNVDGVAESFGGKEELMQNPKYYLEEEPIMKQIPECISILDAGCGVGRYTALVKDKCKVYVGVDFSPKMLEQAKKNNPYKNVEFFEGDLETIDFITILKTLKTIFGVFRDVRGSAKRDCLGYMSCLNDLDWQPDHCIECGQYTPSPKDWHAPEKFDVGLLIAIIRHLPYEKGLAVLRHVADACKTLFFTATIIPEDKEIPMIVKGTGDNIITDHPYHLSDLKKALSVDTISAVPIGDRDPTDGDRYLFRVGEQTQKLESQEPAPSEKSKNKPWNRLSTMRRKIHG